MSHKPIIVDTISLYINNKICFEQFSTYIYAGKHIAIIGSNGTGKSTLLKIIQGIVEPTAGCIILPDSIVFGYVPQTITECQKLSGGQRFNKVLSQALSLDPDVLCLDEPTNHLDLANKRSLIGMLQRYKETLIVVSHDPDILALNFDEIWHIAHNRIEVFTGNYAEYLREHDLKQQALEHHRMQLHKEKRKLHKSVQQEHKRAAQSKSVNKNENDRNLLGAMKESGSRTAGKQLKRLSSIQSDIENELSKVIVHKPIEAKFNLDSHKFPSGKSIISIIEGSCGYTKPVLHNINLQVHFGDRIAIIGDNGTGKSTFLKVLSHNSNIITDGTWIYPAHTDSGYLDQHYSNLNPQLSVTQVIQEAAPTWTDKEIRKHLNNFLFYTQQAVSSKIVNLSGGEKARLSLAQIAAKSPYLLLLDEITNNIDLETRRHIVETLKQYPGTLIMVTHDLQFITDLSIETVYETKNGQLVPI